MVSQRTNPNPNLNGVAEDLRCQILHIEDSADVAIRRKRLADDSSSAQWKPDSATGFRSDITADTDLSSAVPSGVPSGAMDTQAQMMKVK